jgi:hypothetical protein
LWLTIAVLAILIAPSAFACPVCYGAPDDPMVQGVNKGIWALLGFIAFVQIGFLAMFWAFWKKARDHKRFRDQFHVVHSSERGELHP